jgi:hypothetical protein
MTPLRKRMLEELQRRNYSRLTIQSYLHSCSARLCPKCHQPITVLERLNLLWPLFRKIGQRRDLTALLRLGVQH